MQALGKLYSYAYIASGNAAAAANRGTTIYQDTIFAAPWSIVAGSINAANSVVAAPRERVKFLTKVDAAREKRKLPAPTGDSKRLKTRGELIQDLFTSDFEKLDTKRLEKDTDAVKDALRQGVSTARQIPATILRYSTNQ